MTIRAILLLSMLIASSFVVGCAPTTGRTKRGAKTERLPKMEVVEPARKRLQRRIELAATVEAMWKVDVSARVPGVVKFPDQKMDVGRHVSAGEVMVVLDVPDLDADLSQRKAALEQAKQNKRVAYETWQVAIQESNETKKEQLKFEADLRLAQVRLTRISALVKERAQDPAVEDEAKRMVDSSRGALSANVARIAKREARVVMAEAEHGLADERIKVAQSEQTRAEEMVKFATVRAPFDGVIVRRHVDSGAITKDSGTTLFTFMQMDRVRVLIDVPQRDVALLNAREQNPNPDGKGDAVMVSIPALSHLPNRGRFEGTVTRVSRSLDAVTRTMRAEIELANPNLEMRPGMFGSASVLVEDRTNVLTVPASALVRRGDGLVEVYVVEGTRGTEEGEEWRGVLRLKPVLLGIDDGKEVEVREGLRGGELVVARSTGVIRANDAVLAVPQRDAAP